MKATLSLLTGYADKKSALEVIVRNEVALICKEYHKLYRESPEEAEAQKEREVNDLLAWRDYIEWTISCEHFNSSQRTLEEPSCNFVPRTRIQWAEALRDTINDKDPFVDLLIGFTIGVMLATLSSQLFGVVASRDKLVAEMRMRLKPAQRSSDGGDAVSIAREHDKFKPRR